MNLDIRECKTCNEKYLYTFNGRRCVKCVRERRHEKYEKNKDKFRQRYLDHREEYIARASTRSRSPGYYKRYYQKNKDKIKSRYYKKKLEKLNKEKNEKLGKNNDNVEKEDISLGIEI